MSTTLSLVSTLPRPWRIWLARAGWLTVFLLVVGMFAATLPQAARDMYYYEANVLRVRFLANTFFGSFRDFVNYLLALRLAVVAIFFATALYIAWRKSDDGMVLFVSATLLMMSYLFVFRENPEMWRFPQFLRDALPAIRWLAPLTFVLSFCLLLYLFPDGHFAPSWLRWVVPSTAALIIVFFYNIMTDGAFWGDALWVFSGYYMLGFFLLGVLGQIIRYRRASLQERRQTRHVVNALTAMVILLLGGIFLGERLLTSSWAYLIHLHLTLVVAAFVPVTIGLSAIRYRLWQIDRLLQRALLYGALSLVVMLVYVLLVGSLSLLFQAQVSLWAAAIATGLVAVAAQPLRVGLQRWVNRLLHGAWHDPFAVIATLGRQLENTTTPAAGLANMVTTVAQTLRLTYVGLYAGDEVVAEAGDRPESQLRQYPLTYQGEPVGQLLVAPRSGETDFGEAEARLLRSIARQAGGAVYAAQVTRQLQRSRETLVTTREEERRRLRRDLHDGLGPGLATLAIKAGAAENFITSNPERAARIMRDIRVDAEAMVGEIRRLVNGLRPAALDQLGLLPALRAFGEKQADHGFHLDLAAADLPPLPAAVEVAVYRIAVEAITNAVRHAGATNGMVRLTLNGDLHLEIADDGAGIPADAPPGVGLSAMRERAEEVGGRFQLQSLPGQGTRISVSLPLEQNHE